MSATQTSVPTIASLVPSATDLIVGMGARDRLVAVSTYDARRPDVGTLPKAGDYETIDWELLRSLHPSVLVTQIAPEHQSPGFKLKADALHLQPLNVTLNRLDDVFNAIDQLGSALQEPALAKAAADQMHARLDALKRTNTGRKPIRTLIVVGESGDSVAGTANFLDDLLQMAGGVNVVSPEQGSWPTIDRERLRELKPDVILQLMPDSSPQQKAAAARVWEQSPNIPAVANHRVYRIAENFALQCGWHLPELAERFSKCLHEGNAE